MLLPFCLINKLLTAKPTSPQSQVEEGLKSLDFREKAGPSVTVSELRRSSKQKTSGSVSLGLFLTMNFCSPHEQKAHGEIHISVRRVSPALQHEPWPHSSSTSSCYFLFRINKDFLTDRCVIKVFPNPLNTQQQSHNSYCLHFDRFLIFLAGCASPIKEEVF